jgi:hypothetical protein
MNRYVESDTYVQAGDWLVETLRRKPEGLLLVAAGFALLMRNGRSSASDRGSRDAWNYRQGSFDSASTGQGRSTSTGASEYGSELRDRVSDTARSYAASASEIKNRVTDAASSYAASAADYAADYAENARRSISEGSERLASQAQYAFETTADTMRDQPLLVAALGLAAGAAVAAFFPATDLERRTLGEAREVIADAATRASENLVGAAGQAGERLKAGVAERGLNTEGLKELARDVAETFTTAASGKTEEPRSSDASTRGTEAASRGGR